MTAAKVLCFLVITIIFVNLGFASDKYSSLSNTFAGLGFSVFDRVKPELSDVIKFPDKVIVKDRFSMVLTSSLVEWRDLHNRVFVVCDTEIELSGIYCNSSLAKSNKNNFVYQFESDNQFYKIYKVRFEEKELYIIPESFFFEPKKRSQLNEYLLQLYEIEQNKVSNNIGEQSPTKFFSEIENSISTQLLYVAATILFLLFLAFIVHTYFNKNYQILIKLELVVVFWVFLSLSVYTQLVSKDLSNYADFLIEVLRISSPLRYLLEDNFWVSGFSFITLLMLTLITITVLKKIYTEITITKLFINPSFSYLLIFLLSSLFVLVDTKYFISVAIATVSFGYYSKNLSSMRILKISTLGVIAGLLVNFALLYFTDNYKSKLFPDNQKFIVTPYVTSVPRGKLLEQYIHTRGPVFLNDYLVSFEGVENILNQKLGNFVPKPSFLIFSGEKYENTISMIMNNPFFIRELKQEKFSPFIIAEIKDLKYDSHIKFKVKINCKNSSGYNINFKPYYFEVNSKNLRTDASRINLLDFMGCSPGRETEEFDLNVTPDRFRNGMNLLRFNTGTTDFVEDISISVDNTEVDSDFITNLYNHGIIYSKLSAGTTDLYFFSSEISTPLTISNIIEMKNLDISTIINLMKTQGLIQDTIRIQSEDYGKALFYE